MIQLSPYFTTSITEAVNNPMWNKQERLDMISRHEERQRHAVVRRHRNAGKFLELAGN